MATINHVKLEDVRVEIPQKVVDNFRMALCLIWAWSQAQSVKSIHTGGETCKSQLFCALEKCMHVKFCHRRPRHKKANVNVRRGTSTVTGLRKSTSAKFLCGNELVFNIEGFQKLVPQRLRII